VLPYEVWGFHDGETRDHVSYLSGVYPFSVHILIIVSSNRFTMSGSTVNSTKGFIDNAALSSRVSGTVMAICK
jgi:hypothetical protein